MRFDSLLSERPEHGCSAVLKNCSVQYKLVRRHFTDHRVWFCDESKPLFVGVVFLLQTPEAAPGRAGLWLGVIPGSLCRLGCASPALPCALLLLLGKTLAFLAGVLSSLELSAVCRSVCTDGVRRELVVILKLFEQKSKFLPGTSRNRFRVVTISSMLI